jgi:hypothetical protein
VVKGRRFEVRDDSQLRTGEQVVLFLKEYGPGRFFVVGGPQGRFEISRDGRSGQPPRHGAAAAAQPRPVPGRGEPSLTTSGAPGGTGAPLLLDGEARSYDAVVKQITCICGIVVEGEDDDRLWERAQQHLGADHPTLVGNVSREDILAQAEET